jgi:crotonobetainyl-CoA:carnitine CoA-transferase CaiB-like acyl-CoA transferase
MEETVNALTSLLRDLGLNDPQLSEAIEFQGPAPELQSPHKLASATAAAIAAQAATVMELWRMRTGEQQTVRVDFSDSVHALRPGRYQKQNGYSLDPHNIVNEPVNGFFQCRDGKWIFFVGAYPHLRNGLLRVVDSANTKEALSAAVAKWDSGTLEETLSAEGLTAGVIRTPQEWRSHQHGSQMVGAPVVTIEKIGESEPEPLGRALRPLSGLRVLDLTHIIAGPVVARTLAEQGADVLHITVPELPDPLPMIMDTGIGKRNAYLDLKKLEDVSRMRTLCREADIFVQSWRPGSVARLGFGPEEVSRLRPGVIYVSVSAFGDGPWGDRAAFDQIAQSVTGIAHTEGAGGPPRLVPTYLLNDYLCGYLGAAGVNAALIKRAKEGGSYHVKISLAGTSMWVQSFGLLPTNQDMQGAQIDPISNPRYQRRNSAFGELHQLAPVAEFSRTVASWDLPPAPLGAHLAEWLPLA